MQPSDTRSTTQFQQAGDNAALQTLREGQEIDSADREFVRSALREALPDDEIDRRLLLRSDFVRLSPGSDAHAYARRLIEDEKTSLQASNVASLGEPEGASPPPRRGETPPSRAQASEEAVR